MRFTDLAVLCLLAVATCQEIKKAGTNAKYNKAGKSTYKRQSESETTTVNSQFDENYKKLLTGSSSELDVLNDSAEVVDEALNNDASSGLGRFPSSQGGSRFDEFVLPEDFTKPLDAMKVKTANGGSIMNVYKVPKVSKTKKTPPQSRPFTQPATSRSNNSVVNDFNSEPLSDVNSSDFFNAFTRLYDHHSWDVNSFAQLVSNECFNDMKVYLNDLRELKEWALRASDVSGRYRGGYFYDNDFWMGSMQFCYDLDETLPDLRPRLRFYVVKLLMKLAPAMLQKHQPRLLHVGQCLPRVCSATDVTAIMNRDPAAIVLQQTVSLPQNNTSSQASELNVFETRIVPGNYNFKKDHKVYIFGSITLAVIVLIIIASIYERMLEAKGFIRSSSEMTKAPTESADMKCANETDKYEMNQMNNNNNNNETECELRKIHQLSDLHKLGFLSKLLLCFAYGSNSRVILGAKTNSEDSLTCIHGLRLFTLLWTILVHTYLQMFGIAENRFFRVISERAFFYQVVGNATYSVDTFFFISGLLVVLLFLRSNNGRKRQMEHPNGEDNKRTNVSEHKPQRFWCDSLSKSLLFVFYRFLRLTPAYLFIIVFTELAMKNTYNQSVFTPGLQDHINCNQYWWRNIFYINNFYPLSEMCMMWSWYLANDYQFYVFTIFLLVLSTRYFKFSVITTILALLASWAISIYMSLHFNYTHKVSQPFESFDFLYDKPWQRVGPYIMGMVAGYIIHRTKTPPKVPFIVNVLLWMVSLFILLVIIFGVNDGQLSVMMTSLYVSLGHTAWGFALIWITLSCCWGLAKPINSLLSFNGLLPLSRLTYCAYLIHPTVMMITSFNCDNPYHIRHGMVFTAFLGNACISFVLSFFISLMFEAPVIRLLKLCLRK